MQLEIITDNQKVKAIWDLMQGSLRVNQTNNDISLADIGVPPQDSQQIYQDILRHGLLSHFSRDALLQVTSNQPLSRVCTKINDKLAKVRNLDIQNFAHKNFVDNRPYTEALLFCVLFDSADQTMRVNLNKFWTLYYPVPLVYPKVNDNLEIYFVKNEELLWSLSASYLLIQITCSLGSSAHSKGLEGLPQQLLNSVFKTAFCEKGADVLAQQTAYFQIFDNLQPRDQRLTSDEMYKKCRWSFIDVASQVPRGQYQIFLTKCKNFLIHVNCQSTEEINHAFEYLQGITDNLKFERNVSFLVFLHSCGSQTDKNLLKQLKTLLNGKLRNFGSVEVLENNNGERDKSFENLKLGMMETAFMAGIRDYPERRNYTYDLDQSVFLRFCDNETNHQFVLVTQIMNELSRYIGTPTTTGFSYLQFYPRIVKIEKLKKIRTLLEAYDNPKSSQIKDLEAVIDSEEDQLQRITALNSILTKFIALFTSSHRNLLLEELQRQLKGLQRSTQRSNQLSIEILMREMLFARFYLRDRYFSDLQKVSEAFLEYIKSGQPFEIIDGDNCIPLVQYYQDISRQLSDKAYYVSVLGPQSSGKSTLLKYAFGCHFETSSGRCTNGVYGALQTIRRDSSQSEYLLLIDTEGINSNKRESLNSVEEYQQFLDQNKINFALPEALFNKLIKFDLLLALFCFCVSDTVILNIKGEMDTRMKEFLIICIRGMLILNQQENRANLCLVQNQVANLAIENTRNSILAIYKTITKTDLYEGLLTDNIEVDQAYLRRIIHFEENHIFTLPIAFSTGEVIDNVFAYQVRTQRPDCNFGQQCEQLRREIIEMTLRQDRRQSLDRWLRWAGEEWASISQQRDLCLWASHIKLVKEETFFRNFQRKFLDEKLRRTVEECEELVKCNQAVRIEELVEGKFTKVRESFDQELHRLQQNNGSIEYIVCDCKDEVCRRIQHEKIRIIEEWRLAEQQQAAKFQLHQIKQQMPEDINQYNQQQRLSAENALHLFQTLYGNRLDLIRSQFNQIRCQNKCFQYMLAQVKVEIGELYDPKWSQEFQSEAQNLTLQQLFEERRNQFKNSFRNSIDDFIGVNLSKEFNLAVKKQHTPRSNVGYKYFELKEFLNHPLLRYLRLYQYLTSPGSQECQQTDPRNLVILFISEGDSIIGKFLDSVQNLIEDRKNQMRVRQRIEQLKEEINNFNHEMRQIETELRPSGKKWIYRYALVAWANFDFQNSLQAQQGQRESLEIKIRELSLEFESTVKNILRFDQLDTETVDAQSAKKLLQRVQKSLLKVQGRAHKNKQLGTIRMVGQIFEQEFSNESMRDRLVKLAKDYYTRENGNRIYLYLTNPKQYWSGEMEKRFYDLISQELVEIPSAVKKCLLEGFQQCEALFSYLLNKLRNVRAPNLICSTIFATLQVAEQPLAYAKVLSQLLQARKIRLDPEVEIYQSRGLPMLENENFENSELSQVLVKKLNGVQIYNIKQFLQSSIDVLQGYIRCIDSIVEGFKSAWITKFFRAELEQIIEKSLPCLAACPGCGRGCDLAKNHGQEKHQCSPGHYYIGMKGTTEMQGPNFDPAGRQLRNVFRDQFESCRLIELPCNSNNLKFGARMYGQGSYFNFQEWADNHKEWSFDSPYNDRDVQALKKIWNHSESYIKKKFYDFYRFNANQ